MGVATTLSAPVGTVLERMKKHDLAEVDAKIVAKGDIPAAAGIDAFQGFAFEDSDEAEDFLKAGPGDRFNLSVEEIGQLKAAREKPDEPGKQSAIDQASRQYREFLLQRYKAYRGSGLAKIGPYARYRGTADPSPRHDLEPSAREVLSGIPQGLAELSGRFTSRDRGEVPLDHPSGREQAHRHFGAPSVADPRFMATRPPCSTGTIRLPTKWRASVRASSTPSATAA